MHVVPGKKSAWAEATVTQEKSDTPHPTLEETEDLGENKARVKQDRERDMLQSMSEFSDFQVLAEKMVLVTNEEQYIVWEGYGLRLHIPHNSLPDDLNQCNLQMQVAHSGKFELPEDGVLVSAVYSLTHDLGDKELRHSVTLEMQHCANTSALKDLCVVRSIGVPCKFEIIPGGDFTHSDGYGVINLHRFSRYSILKRIRSFFSSSNDLDYCAKIYYTNILRHQFDFEFIIIRDLDTLAKAIEEKLRNRVSTFEYGPSSIVEFERNEISLDIPTSTCDGWSMKRLNTLLVYHMHITYIMSSRTCVLALTIVKYIW
jgi:hypothetical protein